MKTQNSPLLICKNTAFGYDGNIFAENISFSVSEGDFLCIVGENGSGKSTLIKGILRLIPVYAGEIDYKIDKSEIGYMPQQATVKRDFPANVYEIVLSGRLTSRSSPMFYTKDDRKAAEQNLECLGISELSKICFRELSGGQRQRVLLARALCAAKKLLVLDEPTSGLDPNASREFYKIVKRLNEESQIAIIMVSHGVKNALENARTILHLSHKQLFFGSATEYISTELYARFCGSGENV
jgi:zinc transport system ATP-binding protein